MALCGLSAFLLGYILGLRFRIGILLPVEVAALLTAAGLVLGERLSVGTAGLGLLMFAVAVQAGYGVALACPIAVRQPPRRGALKA